LILQETDPLPIAGDGVTVASVSTSIPQSATGEIALPVLVEGPGITSTNDAMLLRVSTAGISVIAREGDAAPGLADGVVFNGYFGSPVLNHHGDVVFFAGLSGPGVTNENYYGLWRAGAYGLQLILRMGDPPPGVNPPATIHDFIDLAMAENGCVAFRALVMTGPGDNRPGIWATDPCGGLYLIALKGEPLQIAPGDVRVVADLEIAMSAGPSDGRPRSINDDSAVVFSAAFADQSDAILMARLGDACLADTNCDGSVNGGDVPMFVACIVSPSFGCARADLNGDGVSSLQDVSPFVDELIESPDCP
jgi:hypothetical protein